jgi:uncharacterized protein (DUF1778 family)
MYWDCTYNINMDSQSKNQRLDVRINAASKRLFARAAEISGVSMSSFVVEAAKRRAEEIIKEQEALTLNDQARNAFMAALENPPPPNKALRRAAKQFRTK